MSPAEAEDYVEYASRAFIERYHEKEGSPPSGVVFDRFMTSLHRRVRDILGKDISLPHCWYVHGDVVAREDMPFVEWRWADMSKEEVCYTGSGRPVHPRDGVTELIDRYADEFIPEVPEASYADAPFEFQRRFGALLESMETCTVDGLASLFGQAMEVFPWDEFPDMGESARQFESVFSTALAEGGSPDLIESLARFFWNHFCLHLRIHGRCRENVSPVALGMWHLEARDEEEDFPRIIQAYAFHFSHGVSSDPVVAGLLRDREERLSEIDRMLRSLSEDAQSD